MFEAKVPTLPDVIIVLNDGVERKLIYDHHTIALMEVNLQFSEENAREIVAAGVTADIRLSLLRYLLSEPMSNEELLPLTRGVRPRYIDDSIRNAFYAALAEDPYKKKADAADAAVLNRETGTPPSLLPGGSDSASSSGD